MKIAVVPLSQKQQNLAVRIASGLSKSDVFIPTASQSLKSLVATVFSSYRQLVLIMPTGVAVRLIASHLKNKATDPGVVVVDTAGRWAVSLCGGHEGGANQLAYEVAKVVKATPVVTTGSEVKKILIVGVGCRRGQKATAIQEAVTAVCLKAGFNVSEVRFLVTAELKQDEAGLKEAAEALNLPLVFLPLEKLRLVQVPTPSRAAQKSLQVKNVCEAAAFLAATKPRLIVAKTNLNGVSVALVGDEASWQEN